MMCEGFFDGFRGVRRRLREFHGVFRGVLRESKDFRGFWDVSGELKEISGSLSGFMGIRGGPMGMSGGPNGAQGEFSGYQGRPRRLQWISRDFRTFQEGFTGDSVCISQFQGIPWSISVSGSLMWIKGFQGISGELRVI